MQRNTYQGVLVTDGTASYTVFIYKCGLMRWSGSASIGYYAEGTFFQNHPQANSNTANSIACANSPTSVWSNVAYRLNILYEGNMIFNASSYVQLWAKCFPFDLQLYCTQFLT